MQLLALSYAEKAQTKSGALQTLSVTATLYRGDGLVLQRAFSVPARRRETDISF